MALKTIQKANNLSLINVAFHSFECIQYKDKEWSENTLQGKDAS